MWKRDFVSVGTLSVELAVNMSPNSLSTEDLMCLVTSLDLHTNSIGCSDYCFTNINIGTKGRTSDTEIFRNDSL
jgi:hypothetical protein